jgi:lipoprotein-anchoring transpeptidase ErfK/SrfK
MRKIHTITIFLFSVVILMPAISAAGETSAPASIEDLRAQVEILQQEVDRREEEIKGLKHMLKDFEDDEPYLVVDTESNQLTMRQGTAVLHKAICGTGSRVFIEGETGRNWYFETPMGSFTVLGKERNPVWIRPDWSYVEENMPIPPADDPDRFVRDVLGKYAILLGNGYKIHGTKWTHLLGTHFTHGCVSLGDDDLELVYKSVKIGTKVYLY